MTITHPTDSEVCAAKARIDGRDATLAAALRADYDDSLLTGDTAGVEDYLSWVRKVLTGDRRAIESDALPYISFEFEEATDRVSSLDIDEAREFLRREVFVRWQSAWSPRCFTLDGAIVTGVEYDGRHEFIVVRDRDGEEIIPLARIVTLRTIDVRPEDGQ